MEGWIRITDSFLLAHSLAHRYTGMAIRVVQDLGMQHEISLAPHLGEQEGAGGGETQREEIARRRLLFWAVFLLDRFISWGTG